MYSFYQEGYTLGLADGEQAGRIEGRVFGLEKGFEKFLELGRLQGRCSVWKARISYSIIPPTTGEGTGPAKGVHITSPRVQKQVESLALLLTNPPFKNDEESVEEVEETLKRGRNKTKILSNILGEKEGVNVIKSRAVDEESIEDAGMVARGAGRI